MKNRGSRALKNLIYVYLRNEKRGWDLLFEPPVGDEVDAYDTPMTSKILGHR